MSVGPGSPLLARLWAYQAERLPVGKNALLTLALSSASVTASAALAHRPAPGPAAYAVAFALAFATMLVLRVLDEFKDREIDRLHRPERPVPRGLVSLPLLAGIGAGTALAVAAAALALSPAMLWPLLGLAAVMAAMTAHFGLAALMRRSLLLTLASHMLVMPAMDLAVTACEWAPRGASPPGGLWAFLALSYANGCVFEIGRKTWAPGAERPHVESYSSAWGIRRAILAWLGFLGAATGLLCALAAIQGSALVAGLALLCALPVAATGLRFAARPDPRRQAALDAASGLWILASYLIAGYGALLSQRILP